MAEASRNHPSRYVRLTKDQDASHSGPGVEDIRPGELNQPIAVPQLEVRKCCECGQVLPESHRAPADEPWTTGIFGCSEDPESCGIALAILTAIFHGVDPGTSVLIGEGLVFSWWLCSTYTGIFRQQLQKKYHLENAPCDPCLVHCCFHWCANCQEHRERKGRLADNSAVPMTIVNPPPVQEMSTATADDHASTSKNEAPKDEHDDVEVIPL